MKQELFHPSDFDFFISFQLFSHSNLSSSLNDYDFPPLKHEQNDKNVEKRRKIKKNPQKLKFNLQHLDLIKCRFSHFSYSCAIVKKKRKIKKQK